MDVGRLTWIVAAVALASLAPPVSADADTTMPLRRLDLNTFTCQELAAVQPRILREAILVYMNGYFDGTRKATIWDAELVGRRIDEVMRLCAATPKSTLLEAFTRVWTR
jgi:hypothetical protein